MLVRSVKKRCTQTINSRANQLARIVDRCYFSTDLLISWDTTASNSHWLTPVKRKLRYEVAEHFSENNMLNPPQAADSLVMHALSSIKTQEVKLKTL